ncbi:hypothetical protein TELCIR_16443 [Teladorsagia circumcincta]|uniref:Gamma-glutamylcyclotransferase family protein n=1 Tax=Teladorsagia circumcincta TaxID=45464 RepID=A0A2G9TVT1_TELCI|nr:hypothetical protein TELCIR_16443 [Teladorsagia circumcincta]
MQLSSPYWTFFYSATCLLPRRSMRIGQRLQQIQGEVYEIDDVKLKILDALEAYPTLYWRQEEKILMSDNTETTAWIYLMRKWRPDIYEHATPMMSNYSSKGSHGREYVTRVEIQPIHLLRRLHEQKLLMIQNFRLNANYMLTLCSLQRKLPEQR